MPLGKNRQFRWWLASMMCARSPSTMAPLALILAGEAATGSFATGALLAGLCGVTQGVGAPWRGRRLDSPHRPQALRIELAASTAAFALLAVALDQRASVPVLVVLAVVAGLFAGAVPGGYVARLPATVPADALPRALTINAVSIEANWVIGPLLVTGVALIAAPTVAVALIAVSLALALATEPMVPVRDWTDVTERGPSPWSDPLARRTYGLAAAIALTFGLVDASLPALLEHFGLQPALSGILTGIPAATSVLAGSAVLLFHIDLRSHRPRTTAILSAIAGVALLPLAFASSFAGIAATLALAGMMMSPLNAVWSHVLQKSLPASRRAEGFTLLYSSLRVGVGGGALLAAALLPIAGPATLVGVAGLIPLIGALVLSRRPSGLRARSTGTPLVAPPD